MSTFIAERDNRRILAVALMLALGATGLTACSPLVVGGAIVGTSMMVADRRTSGAQIEDQGIELKSVSRIREVIGNRGHTNVISYNRLVLITGEVPTEADRTAVEQAVVRIENVRSTVNELAVMEITSLVERSGDAVLTSRVKAAFVDAKDLHANAIKVITERSTVYLMGRVTEREANRASEVARAVSGVKKVVRVFEVISEAELADSQPAKK